MSVQISPDLRRLPDIVEELFGRALIGDVAPSVARGWTSQIIAVDAIDTGTYLRAVEPGEPMSSGDDLTVTVEAKAAEGYSDIVERGRRDGRVRGRYPAKRGVEAAEGDIKAALDKAGRRVQG